MEDSLDAHYVVWGSDLSAYGPVDFATLVSWVKDERVTPGTWIFNSKDESWMQAAAVGELRSLFLPYSSRPGIGSPACPEERSKC